MALTTFLVEDNKTIRDNLISTLEEMGGARVIGTAETELAAILWLQSHDGQWDLAIVDLFLKEGSGLGVLQGCKEREPHQRVVVLSNYATDEIKRRSMALGADAVFDKSTELEVLLDYCQRT
jgi:DNA-binding NarL/FixJ family response regulator